MKTLQKLLDAIGPYDALVIDKYQAHYAISLLRDNAKGMVIKTKLKKTETANCIKLSTVEQEGHLKRSLQSALANARTPRE